MFTTGRDREEFLAHIEAAFRNEPGLDAGRIARAVFALLARKLDPGAINKVIPVLPAEVRELWPAHMVESAMPHVGQTQ